jgi:hypothetical protein
VRRKDDGDWLQTVASRSLVKVLGMNGRWLSVSPVRAAAMPIQFIGFGNRCG